MSDAGITDKRKCYFIDDSPANCEGAIEFGWKNVVQKLEPEDPNPVNPVTEYIIRDMEELRTLFPEIFKST